MKHTTTRFNLIKTVCVLGLTSFGNLAMAHGFSGVLNGNAGVSSVANAAEVWQLECNSQLTQNQTPTDSPLPAQRMVISVRDITTGGSLVGLTLSKVDMAGNLNVKKAQTTIDLVGGSTNFTYSPTITVEGGEGIYYATVFHTGAANDSYAVTYHCERTATPEDTNTHTITSPAVQLTNQ